MTNENGEYTLKVTDKYLNHVYFNKAPLLSIGGIDIDTGKEFKGILEAPKDLDKDANLTPIRTLVTKILSKKLKAKINVNKDEIKKLIKEKKNL